LLKFLYFFCCGGIDFFTGFMQKSRYCEKIGVPLCPLRFWGRIWKKMFAIVIHGEWQSAEEKAKQGEKDEKEIVTAVEPVPGHGLCVVCFCSRHAQATG
jgi:hypothetical protein